MQVHRQMVHMLASIPEDVPVAAFLLGRRLKMIQNFTTDPKLLKGAVQKTSSVESDNATQVEPQDDPDALSAFLEDEPNFSASSLMALQQFERESVRCPDGHARTRNSGGIARDCPACRRLSGKKEPAMD